MIWSSRLFMNLPAILNGAVMTAPAAETATATRSMGPWQSRAMSLCVVFIFMAVYFNRSPTEKLKAIASAHSSKNCLPKYSAFSSVSRHKRKPLFAYEYEER